MCLAVGHSAPSDRELEIGFTFSRVQPCVLMYQNFYEIVCRRLFRRILIDFFYIYVEMAATRFRHSMNAFRLMHFNSFFSLHFLFNFAMYCCLAHFPYCHSIGFVLDCAFFNSRQLVTSLRAITKTKRTQQHHN